MICIHDMRRKPCLHVTYTQLLPVPVCKLVADVTRFDSRYTRRNGNNDETTLHSLDFDEREDK